MLEAIGGKRGGQVLAGILNDFTEVDRALKTMEGAAGSADQEMGIIRDSIEYKLNSLKQTWVGVLTDVLDRGDMKGVLDFLISVSEGLGGIVSNLGFVKTALIGIAGFLGASKLKLFDFSQDGGIGITGLGGMLREFVAEKDEQKTKDADAISNIIKYLKNGDKTLDDVFNTDELDDTLSNLSEDVADKILEIGTASKDSEKQVAELQTQLGKTSQLKSFASSVANVGKALLSTFANFAVSAGVTALVSWIGGKLIDAIDSWSISAEEAAEMTETFRGEFDTFQKSTNAASQEMSGIEDEFNVLSKGVNVLGENVSLTDDEFKRYHEITSIIAQNAPNLIDGYDAQGNAIIRLTNNVKGLSEAYEEEQRKQAAALWNEKGEDGNLIVRGTLKNAKDKLRSGKNQYQDYDAMLGLVESYAYASKEELEESYKRLSSTSIGGQLLKEAGVKAEMTDAEAEAAHQKLLTYATNYKNDAELAAKDVSNAGITYAKSLHDFWDLTEEQQKYMLSALQNLDVDFINNNNLTDIEELQSFVINMTKDIKNADLDQLNIRMNLITELNNGEISVDEYLDKVGELNEWLNSLPEDDNLTKLYTILFKVATEGETNVNQGIDRLKELLGDNYSDEILKEITPDQLKQIVSEVPVPDYGKLTAELAMYENKLQELEADHQGASEEADGYRDKITEIKGELDRFKPAETINPFIPMNLQLEWDHYQVEDVLNKLKKEESPIEFEAKIKASDAVDSMADMKTAVSSLGDLWEQTVQNQRKLGKDKKYMSADGTVSKEADTNGLAIGSADPALINSVESAFSNYISTLSDDQAAKAMNTALKQFEETMVQFPGDAEAAQKAIDTLINSYIDQTKVLDNLNESNKQWSIDQLKAMGVTNAEAVVTSRLIKENKQLLNGMYKLNDAFRTYGKAIDQGVSAGKEYRDGMNELKSILNDMFTQVDENGNKTGFEFDFDDTFILEHLDMIRQAAYGDVDALNDLRREASKSIIANIEIHNPNNIPQRIDDVRNEINDLIAGVDLDKLEIGTEFDDKNVINGLNHMVNMGEIAQQDMNAILAGIGVTPEVTQVDVPYNVENLTKALEGMSGVAATEKRKGLMALGKAKGTISLPQIQYKVSSKIAGAHFNKSSAQSDSSTSGNGSNSSNGSDNKLQEDTKETFDWIEVKIQRLDEAIARLDKTVGNTYKTWGKRNKALGKELEKVAEEVKVHEHAQKRYLENAKALKISDVNKKPKKSDYSDNKEQYEYDLGQYKQAVKDWKTGKYQKLVREGKIGKDDIQYIENKYLADAIKQYTEIYNKAVQAGDAIEDDKIKLGDLNKTKFDDIKSEYEGLISLIEDANNLVEERINNTQERGYFVNKKYYQQEIANVKEERKKKEIEYKKLIKIRDDAVASGAIEKDSEAWVQMTNDINAAELALMQYDTEIVKLNNDIRQLKWDAFDFMQGRLDRINSETETLIDLLDSLPLFDDNGEFTNRGRATESLYGIQYDVAAKKAEEYRKAIKELEKTMDPYDQKEIERLDAMRDGLWEQTKAMEAAKDATKDLIANGIQKHIEALNKLIDKYKQSLSDAKSLYDYQKNIANQTKNIASLERQLAAYAGDDSEESRANIQKLTEQLEEARTGLKETEWDKYISETNDMLDDMMTDYQEYMDRWLEDVDAVFEWAVSDVNSHVDEISKTLKTVAGDDGISLTSQLKSMLETSISNNTALITAYTKGNAELSSTAEQILDKIIANAKDVTSGTQGGSTSGNKNSSTSSNKTSSTNSNKKSTNTKTSPEELQRQAIEKEKRKKGEEIEKQLEALTQQETKAKQDAEKELSKKGVTKKQTKTIKENLEKALKNIENQRRDYQQMLDDLNKYATGSRNIASNQLAWTQENGSELIFRKSDGAMLTPLNRGDMVFTKDMSQALWNIAKNPNILKQTVHIPNRTINNDNNLTVVLPNVMNYDQFKNAMMNDPKVKNFVQATTIGQALGKGKLNRGNL